MAERRPGKGVPAGLELRVEAHWCVQCRAECTVQIMQLAADPEPIAICAECGTGVDMWLSADVVEAPVVRLPQHRAGRHQGAA